MIPRGTVPGDYPFTVASSLLSDPPEGATHVLMVVDPNAPFEPDKIEYGRVPETDEHNNVMSIPVQRCAAGTMISDVVLPRVSTELATVKSAHLQLFFDELSLNFQVIGPTEEGVVCVAQSSIGSLPVSLVVNGGLLNGGVLLVGSSTGSATLTLMETGLLRWQTSGFAMVGQGLVPLGNTGPLSYFFALSEHGLTIDSPFETIVRVAESVIHQELSDLLFGQFRNLVVWEDPGPTSLLATDSLGRSTGQLGSSVVNEIPGSVYLDSIPLLVVTAPESEMSYDVRVVGKDHGEYELISATLQGSTLVTSQTYSRTTEVDNVDVFSMEWSAESTNVVGQYVYSFVAVDGDLNLDQSVDAADAGLMFRDWGTAGAGDLNQDGIVDAADAGIMFSNWTGDVVTNPDILRVAVPLYDCRWFDAVLSGYDRRSRFRGDRIPDELLVLLAGSHSISH